jgi:hypothetical protein
MDTRFSWVLISLGTPIFIMILRKRIFHPILNILSKPVKVKKGFVGHRPYHSNKSRGKKGSALYQRTTGYALGENCGGDIILGV